MNKVVIVGAGGLGRELFTWIQNANTYPNFEKLDVCGFIDDDLSALDHFNYPVKVISRIDTFLPEKKIKLIVAIGIPKIKKKVINKLENHKSDFLSFIHPGAVLGHNVSLGKGVIVCPGVIVSCDVKLGDFVFMNMNSTVGHDVTVGNFTTISGKVEITSSNNIGDYVMFGVGSKTIPGLNIGSGSTIGAGSIVIKNVKSRSTVFGNPAKIIREDNGW